MIESKTIQTENKPTSFKFTFDEPTARLTVLAFEAGNPTNVYYRRYIHNAVSDLNVRFPVTPGALQIVFQTENPFGIREYLKYPCERRIICHEETPEVTRSFGLKDLKIVTAEDLGGTPAKIVIEGPDAGTIFLCQKNLLNKHTQQTRAFVITHETRHTFFNDEEKTDESAFYEYMRAGYNLSGALFALTDILKRNPATVNRMAKMYYLTQGFNEKHD